MTRRGQPSPGHPGPVPARRNGTAERIAERHDGRAGRQRCSRRGRSRSSGPARQRPTPAGGRRGLTAARTTPGGRAGHGPDAPPPPPVPYPAGRPRRPSAPHVLGRGVRHGPPGPYPPGHFHPTPAPAIGAVRAQAQGSGAACRLPPAARRNAGHSARPPGGRPSRSPAGARAAHKSGPVAPPAPGDRENGDLRTGRRPLKGPGPKPRPRPASAPATPPPTTRKKPGYRHHRVPVPRLSGDGDDGCARPARGPGPGGQSQTTSSRGV
jgi:hypothetical protein